MVRIVASGLALVLLLAGCGAPDAESTPTDGPTRTGSSPVATSGSPAQSGPATGPDGRSFVVTEQHTFDEPWAMAFLPGTDWLAVSERNGKLWLRDQSSGELVEVVGVPQVHHAGQAGLGDIIPAPDFETSQQLYLSWSEAGQGGAGAAVGRARLAVEGQSAQLEGLEVIWRQQPKVSGDGHFSQRLAFSPDGESLFVTSGDRQKFDPAQDPNSDLGKVIRIDLGNDSAEHWTLGHRNPLGIAFDPDGRLWASEMGPQGGDELNLIVEGANYGWPQASNGSHYGGGEIPDHVVGDGFEAPALWWTPSISPGSLMIYDGPMFTGWQGDAFLGALSGEALIRVDLDGDQATEADHWSMDARIREVEQGPDGSIWLLEDAGTGRLLQLTAV